MKPIHCVGAGIFVGALMGFFIAWEIKPPAENSSSQSASTMQTRADRRSVMNRPPSRPTLSEFSRRWQEANDAEDGMQTQEALLADLSPKEFPALLAEMFHIAGLSGLDNPGDNQLRELFNAWYKCAPEEALAWLHALPKDYDRQRLLYPIVVSVAKSDLDAAVTMLRKYSADNEGFTYIPDEFLVQAVAISEDKFLEVCKLGLNQNISSAFSCKLNYPEGFNFRKVLNELAAAEAALNINKDKPPERSSSVPPDLITEWAKRDFEAAWAWLQEGKDVSHNSMDALISSVPPADAGALLASTFDPTSKGARGYRNVVTHFYSANRSPLLLDSFLQKAPGGQTVHLEGLFDDLRGADFGELHLLLLERMSPEQRTQVMQRGFENGVNSETRTGLGRHLRGLGHDEEEIEKLLPKLRE